LTFAGIAFAMARESHRNKPGALVQRHNSHGDGELGGAPSSSDDDEDDTARLLPSLLDTTVDDVDAPRMEVPVSNVVAPDEASMSKVALNWKKWTALVLLTVQSVVGVAIMHYTRVRPRQPNTVRYASSRYMSFLGTSVICRI
jgi:hypothetical protein